MKDIKCPKCGTVFQVDESDYAAILAQVRNEELDRRVEELREQFRVKEQSVKLAAEKTFEGKLSQKDQEVSRLQNEITRLTGVISGYEATKKSELSELENKKTKELFDAVTEKDRLISRLEAEIANKDNEHRVAILKERSNGSVEIQKRQQEIVKLQADIESGRLAAENRENQLREQHKLQLQDKQDEIDRLKDFKMRLSTKMVGETLEQHCSIQFAQAQSMGLYPDATFEKDNTAVEHSKGDFIFRDYIDGVECVSVMFEMKNEMDSTSAKHRNDDFLDKLDKDRQRKNCEYAVLVSMLEQGNELYDACIVDKSHRYPKMIVIRPQFFLPVLRLISEGARRGFVERNALQKELNAARSQSMDFAKFEDKLNRFRTSFNNNITAAHKKFVAATEGIDKTIDALERQIKALRDIKANFEASEQRLLKANELADEDLTVKKLTYGNPTIRKMIDDAR
ncbi:MAG: DUF2130 domain-containing protein [Muribaculaceae bacterium]|nr:DUF2130 domain-containing protein [Muribaculaceae bacterium]